MNIVDNLLYLPKVGIIGAIEILILTILVYYIAKTMQGTRAWVLIKGVMILLGVYLVSYLVNFQVIVIIFDKIILFLGILIIMALQPELRKIIEKIGARKFSFELIVRYAKSLINNKQDVSDNRVLSDMTIQEIAKGCFIMGKAKTGALIVIENEIPLNEYVATGICLNADITNQLLINIFEHNTPLHDGAIIIRNNKIISATCYLPLSNNEQIDKNLGTRHRAGIGVSENSDCVVVIVSEETGYVSIVKDGIIKHNINREQLIEELNKIKKRTIKINGVKSVNKLTHNFGVKALSFISTITLWFMVMSTVNPVTTATIKGVPIEVKNTETLTNLGKTYDIGDNKYVSVKLRGRKNDIDTFSRDNLHVYADISKVSLTNTVELEVDTSDDNIEAVLSQNTINIALDDIVDTEYNIEIVREKEPSNKFYISDIELSSQSIIVSGPKTLVNKIGSVKVEIDASEITEDTELSLEPIIYDKNGDIMSKDRLKLNNDNIVAKIKLYNTKLVPLNINTNINSDMIRYILDNTYYQDAQIYIAGSDADIKKVKSIDIDINIDDIDLDDISKRSFSKNINIIDYLPEGIYVGNQYSKEELIINFKDFFIKTLEFNSSDINVIGGTKENTIIADKLYKVNIISFSKIDDKISFSPYIDIQGINKPWAGNINVQLSGVNEQMKIFGDTEANISCW